MCLAKIYINKKGDKPIIQDIAGLRILEGQLEIETLAGTKQLLLGKISEIDFLTSSIILDTTINELNIV